MRAGRQRRLAYVRVTFPVTRVAYLLVDALRYEMGVEARCQPATKRRMRSLLQAALAASFRPSRRLAWRHSCLNAADGLLNIGCWGGARGPNRRARSSPTGPLDGGSGRREVPGVKEVQPQLTYFWEPKKKLSRTIERRSPRPRSLPGDRHYRGE